MGACWGSIINDSLEGHWVRSPSFPLSREPYSSPILNPPSHPPNGVCPLSTTQICCRTYIEGSNAMSQGVMAMRVFVCVCVSVGDSPLGLLCCWWWLTGIYGYVWMHRSEHRATASATASVLPPWHHHGDVLLVQGTASSWCSKPMRERKKEIGGGPSTLCVVL